MIHSETFVWLHFPKTAGTAVEKIFDTYFSHARSIHRDRVTGFTWGSRLGILSRLGVNRWDWHDSLASRQQQQPQFRWDGKVVISGLRRLPEWLYSRHTYSIQCSPSLAHRQENLLEGRFFERTGILNHADNYANYYLPPGVLDSGLVRIIRCEHFREDFLEAFRDLIPCDRIPENAFSTIYNRTHVRDDRAWDIIQSHRERLYAACPYWAQLEARFYPPR